MDEKEELHLTSQELQVLSELDSRQFGFLKLRGTEHGRTRALVLKAVKYLEGMLVQVKEEERACSPGARRDICIDPKTYCKLGHFHLLLEDYAKAMSAYQKFYALEQDNWKDPLFLYGLGLCYYHYNAFDCLVLISGLLGLIYTSVSTTVRSRSDIGVVFLYKKLCWSVTIGT